MPPWILGVAALAFTVLGWLWFVVNFTVQAAGWWNSLYFFAAIYSVAAILGLFGIRSSVGILGLILALLSLSLVLVFIFGSIDSGAVISREPPVMRSQRCGRNFTLPERHGRV